MSGGVLTHEENEERRVAGSQKYNCREDERSTRNVRRSARGMRVARRKGGRLSAVQPQRERGGVSTHEDRKEWRVAGSQKYNRREDERGVRNMRRSVRGVRVARRKGGRLSAVQPQRERGGVSTHEEREERRVAHSQKYNHREDERSIRNVRRSVRGMRVARRKGGRLSAVQLQRERGGVSTHEEREERRVAGSQKYNRREDERGTRNVRRSARGMRVARRKGGRLSAVQLQRERGGY